jgi:hypothetical protein
LPTECLRPCAEFAGGLLRGHVDRAARGVAPEQRALRAAQHLDALEVGDVEHGADRLAHEHAVDVEADLRVREQRGLAWPTPRMEMFMFEFEEGCFWIETFGAKSPTCVTSNTRDRRACRW